MSAENDRAAADHAERSRRARMMQYALTRALVHADQPHNLPALDKMCRLLEPDQLHRLCTAAETAAQGIRRFIDSMNREDGDDAREAAQRA